MYTTRVSRLVNAPRPVVHRALVSAEAITRWRVPPGMRGEVLEFETEDPALRGTMTMSTTLTDTDDGGTAVLVVREGVPEAVPAADNEADARWAPAHLARFVESDGADSA